MNRYTELRLKLSKEMNKDISQRDLSKLLGIPQSRISELESGKKEPSLAELKAYHLYFRVSYEYLFDETDMYVCTDIFDSKPRVETKEENTLRWLNDTTYPDEIELAQTTNFLLSTNIGLLLLYYSNQYFKGKINKNTMLDIMEESRKDIYKNYLYNELRLTFDAKFLPGDTLV